MADSFYEVDRIGLPAPAVMDDSAKVIAQRSRKRAPPGKGSIRHQRTARLLVYAIIGSFGAIEHELTGN
jgi:hypothetical protein